MNNKYMFLILAAICFAIGLFAPGPIITGFGKALGGVFFILYFIKMLFENEPADESKHH